ncbi:MAG: acyltransferase family protein [Thermoplasmatota archaeon]
MPKELRPLTSLRFFAALYVVLFHTVQLFIPPSSLPWWALNIIASGYLGVSFFFVLSGFILVHRYLGPKGDFRGTKGSFAWARFARIYPIYVLSLLLAVPAMLLTWSAVPWASVFPAFPGWNAMLVSWSATLAHPADPRRFYVQLAAAPLLLQAWIPATWARTWNGPGWSLSAEMFFYALFPLLAPAILRLHGAKRWALAAAVWVTSTAAAVAYVAWDAHPNLATWLTDDSARSLVYMNPLFRLPEFLIGVVAGAWYSGAARGTPRSHPRPSARLLGVGALGAILAMVLAAGIFFPRDLLLTGILSPFFACLIVACAPLGTPTGTGAGSGLVTRVLSSRAMVFLGNASYAFYLLHFPLGILFLLATAPLGLAGPLWLAFYLATMLAAAALTYRFIEHPARQWLRASEPRRLRAPGPTPAGAAGPMAD